jgi:acyl carrier protein
MTISRQSLLDRFESEFGLNISEISDDTLLFSTGLLDSFSVAELLVFLEEQCNFTVEPTEVTLDNLDSVDKILAFVKRKNAAAAS